MSSSTEDQKDICDLLTSDHEEVTALIKQCADETDAHKRRELAEQFTAALIRHAVGEEQHVYPIIRDKLPDGKTRYYDVDLKEHQHVEEILAQIEKADPDTPAFTSLLDALEKDFNKHKVFEEGEQFPLMRKHLSHEELMDAGQKFLKIKKMAPTRPHPSAPRDPKSRAILGPAVATIDKMRDFFSGRSTEAASS